MVKTCSKCNKEKTLNNFHFRKDSKKYRNECKECWRFCQASRRYGITFEQAEKYYKQSYCMCCGVVFTRPKQKHIHHVGDKVKGVVCRECNIFLRQETSDHLHRLKSCLSFMSKPRKNLFDKVNSQGSRCNGELCGPSTTARRAPNFPIDSSYLCKVCNRKLPSNQFYKQKNTQGIYKPIKTCKGCQIIYCKAKYFGLSTDQIMFLRSKTLCDCCGDTLKLPYIHHVKDRVLGTVCRECNLFLEQESEDTKHRIASCVNWILGDDTV